MFVLAGELILLFCCVVEVDEEGGSCLFPDGVLDDVAVFGVVCDDVFDDDVFAFVGCLLGSGNDGFLTSADLRHENMDGESTVLTAL